MANCKYCGAKMEFVETNNGGKMPVDPELVSSSDCEHGDVLVTEDGRVFKVNHNRSDYEETFGYVSHFATCPHADRARQSSKAKKNNKRV